MDSEVRVRFAPSPTGPLHIGGVRTAFFNYLFAKKYHGTFVLRIEDTDQSRYVPGAEEYIVEALSWCGISPDEGVGKEGEYGPYRQSERRDIYKHHIDRLLEEGNAYIAFDSTEALDAHRKEHKAKGKAFIYNWHNRLKLDNALSLTPQEVKERITEGEPYVVRFRTPLEGKLSLHDLVRGEITIDTRLLDDKILYKNDGMPTYHLANIVDDHLMKISHVIRGEEWLPSLALHILLYKAFGWEPPEFAHLPLILKPSGKGKLSKRDSEQGGFPIFPLAWKDPKGNTLSQGYREDGYFNDALINFLAFLGWNPGTEQEILTLDELVEAFSLDRVQKGGARFDPEKAAWYNHQYLQKRSDAELAEDFLPLLKEKGVFYTKPLEPIVSLLKDRVSFVKDFWEAGYFFFEAPTDYNDKAVKKQWKEDTSEIMRNLVKVVESIEDFSSSTLQSTVKGWITEQGIGLGRVMAPLRLALVGALSGPDMFSIMSIIGKEETTSRIESAVTVLG